MARGDCVVGLTPRWICFFKKGSDAFTLRFNQLDDMLISCARAKSIGYTVKTMPAKAERRDIKR